MSSASSSRRTIRTSPARRPPPRAPARRKRKGGGAAGILVGTVGWLAALALIGFMVYVRMETEEELDAIIDQFNADIAELQEEMDLRQDRITVRNKNLVEAINEENRVQAGLRADIQAVESVPPRLENKRDELKQTANQLEEQILELRDEAGLVGESRYDVMARLRRAQGQRNRLKQQYIRDYYAMLERYQDAVDKDDAEQSQRFFNTHRDTPFAPAAAFDAGEKFRMEGDADSALRMYGEITRNYPDSAYAPRAEDRIRSVKNEEPGWDQPGASLIRFHPYKYLDIVD